MYYCDVLLLSVLISLMILITLLGPLLHVLTNSNTPRTPSSLLCSVLSYPFTSLPFTSLAFLSPLPFFPLPFSAPYADHLTRHSSETDLSRFNPAYPANISMGTAARVRPTPYHPLRHRDPRHSLPLTLAAAVPLLLLRYRLTQLIPAQFSSVRIMCSERVRVSPAVNRNCTVRYPGKFR